MTRIPLGSPASAEAEHHTLAAQDLYQAAARLAESLSGTTVEVLRHKEALAGTEAGEKLLVCYSRLLEAEVLLYTAAALATRTHSNFRGRKKDG